MTGVSNARNYVNAGAPGPNSTELSMPRDHMLSGHYRVQAPSAEAPVSRKVALTKSPPKITRQATSVPSHNMRLYYLGAVTETLRKLGGLPKDAEMSVDPKVAERASDLVSALVQSWRVAVPSLFPQEHETVVFKWDQGPVSRYLTVSDEEVNLLDFNPIGQIACEHELGGPDRVDLTALIREMGASSLSSTSLTDVDD